MMKSVTRTFGIALSIILITGAAEANGRFPRALRLIEDPNDINRLTLAATFGLVVTSDRGRNWYHICEGAFSLQDSYNGDPLVSVLPSGAMLVDVQASLNVSRNQGCQWTPTIAGSAQTVADFTLSKSNPNLVLAVVTSFQDGGAQSRLQESTDSGATFKVIGSPLPAPLVYTIDVDPADPTHIFATALTAASAGVFLRSTDHGATWITSTIPNTGGDESPYIAAIDPNDANKIYVRTDASPVVDGIATGNDALLYSSDAGQTWTEILRKGAKIYGFALSPDGSTVLAGYGDPVAAEIVVDPDALGLYTSPTNSFSFSRIFNNSVTCLTWSKTGLYACTSSLDTRFELEFAPDSNLARCPFTPLLNLMDIRGTLPGCASVAATCDFSAACALFDCDGGMRPTVPAVTPGCAVTGAGDGGTDGAGAGVDASAGTSGNSGGDSSSGCSLTGGRRNGDCAERGAGLLLALGLAVRARSGARRRKLG